MNAEDVLGLLVPATYFTMLAVERFAPARQFPRIPGWRWIGIGFFLMTGAFATVFPLLLPLDWLAEHRLLDGTGLGVVGGTVLGLLAVSLVGYWYHRATHSFSWLWRLTHQLHHGPQRVDMYGAALFHPTDIAVYIVFPLILTTFVLGLDPLAAGIVSYLVSFLGFFEHWNIATPKWLGYFLPRPEMHCIHHQRGVHAYNYADFPLWDILFGTFQNPTTWSGDAGFECSAAKRWAAMLAFRDVNQPVYGAGNRGAPNENRQSAFSGAAIGR